MTKEEFFKMLAALRVAPKVEERLIRINPINPDGILRKNTKAEGLQEGVRQTKIVTDISPLPCGHFAEVGLTCCCTDEYSPQPHVVCRLCMGSCIGCGVNCCLRHLVEIEAQKFCPACAQKLELDNVGRNLLGFFDGFLG